MVVRRGVKHPEVIRDSSKTSTSVMFCVSTIGEVIPPYTVYKSLYLYPTWVEGGIKDGRYNRNISGWFEINIFEDWFIKLFIPFVKNLKGPKVLIGDNLASHLSLEVIKLCEIHNIRFILLPPNSTHLCQPLDHAFFRPLKVAWRKNLDDWKKKNKGVLPKALFPKMLKDSLEAVKSHESNIKAGFKAAGIVPFDKEHVIRKVPVRQEDEINSNDLLNSSWTEAFVSVLQNFRLNDSVPKKHRSKKITVEPGKSIRAEDFNKDEEFIDETEPDPENNQPSTSKERTTYNKPEEPDELDLDDFILVKYQMDHETTIICRQYIGQVIGIDYPIIDVNFLRKKNFYSGSPFFVYPPVPDKSRINAEQVVLKLKLSKKLKRDRYIFDLDVADVK